MCSTDIFFKFADASRSNTKDWYLNREVETGDYLKKNSLQRFHVNVMASQNMGKLPGVFSGVPSNNKENFHAPHDWTFVGDQWFTFTNGQ